VKSVLAAIRAGGIKGLAHITGGGVTENLPRVLPEKLDAEIDLDSWRLPPVFGWLAREAGLPESEMLRTFNCGVGLIVVTDAARASDVIAAFNAEGENAFVVGGLQSAEGSEPAVRYTGSLRGA
jgi:phosphoribosylformylglycinamidine cyclo-ligase